MAKAKKKSETVRLPKEMLEELLRVGGLMSNICFSVAQPSRGIDAATRVTADKLRADWDAVLTKVRDQLKGQ